MSEAEDRTLGSLAGHGFAFAIPGKYPRSPHDKAALRGPRVRAWSPLFGFLWPGTACQITDNVSLIVGESYKGFEAEPFKRFLSAEEIEECRSIGHWLEVNQDLYDEVSVRVRMNCFLLALWLVQPTRTYLAMRFEEIENGEHLASRILERFQWIEGYVAEELSSPDIERVRIVLPLLLNVYGASRRLRNALILTFRARVSTDWQSSFICLTAAAEALLTYSQGPGLVGRLADAFARLTGSSDPDRRVQNQYFKRLYSVRSKIMHGRAHDRRNGEANLSDLAAMGDAIRLLWGRILESPEVMSALDADDHSRSDLFNGL